jgi:predicted 2-oxoglutarate/Fe(II)-dependent dioxygenase YbiX
MAASMKRNVYLPYFESAHESRGIISIPLFDRESCGRIISWSRATQNWLPAEVHVKEDRKGSAVRDQYRSANTLIPPKGSELEREFAEKVDQIIRPIIECAWQEDFPCHEDTHLVRYTPGGFYVPHVDVVPGSNYRYFTVLCYLNEDFEGGATTFPLFNLSVKPEIGKAILFPSSYIHSAEVITRGEKYVLVSWLTSTPPINWL